MWSRIGTLTPLLLLTPSMRVTVMTASAASVDPSMRPFSDTHSSR